MAVGQLVCDAATWCLVSQLQSLGTKPLGADDRDDLIRQNASDCCGRLEVFEGHSLGGRVSRFVEKASPGARAHLIQANPHSFTIFSIISEVL
jgi:hypothetical protein